MVRARMFWRHLHSCQRCLELWRLEREPSSQFSLIDMVFLLVTMWEAYTRGELPYSNIHTGLFQYLIDGGRLTRPHNCPEEIYYKLLQCWNSISCERPKFDELRRFFESCAPIYANIVILVKSELDWTSKHTTTQDRKTKFIYQNLIISLVSRNFAQESFQDFSPTF
jgi:hypothetical protein